MSKHEWELVKTTWEYPNQQGTGALLASEYAYLLCQECEQVVKRRIETTLPARHRSKEKGSSDWKET